MFITNNFYINEIKKSAFLSRTFYEQWANKDSKFYYFVRNN